jgi:hypothetical protein
MYKELAGDRPRPGDAADLLLGGLRERLRAAGLAGVTDALPAAAVFALSALSALSVYYLLVYELHPETMERAAHFGPFASLYVCAYVGWLVTAVTAAVVPGRIARIAGAVSLTVVVAGILLRIAGASFAHLFLFVPLPLAVLGVLTLALPASASWTARLAPVVTAVLTGLGAVLQIPVGFPEMFPFGGKTIWDPGPESYGACCYYRLPATYVLYLVALALLATGLVLAVVHARQGRSRGAWILLILASPIAALMASWLSDTVPEIRSIAFRLTAWNEIQVFLIGLLLLPVTAVVLPLVAGQIARRRTRRPTPAE